MVSLQNLSVKSLHIADFGISKQLESLQTETGTFAGTVKYMAPEVLILIYMTPEVLKSKYDPFQADSKFSSFSFYFSIFKKRIIALKLLMVSIIYIKTT